jgi:hypothetical protein
MLNLWRILLRTGRLGFVLFTAVLLLQRSELEPGKISDRVSAYTRAIQFDYVTWTLDALGLKLGQIGLGAVDYLPAEDQKQIVLDYLDLLQQIWQTEGVVADIYADPGVGDPFSVSAETRRELKTLYHQRDQLALLAESILQNQISLVAADLGLAYGGQVFPPIQYHITALPMALIVSPREVIRQDVDASLLPDLTLDQQVALEDQVDRDLNVSSLVVEVGGVGMYPTMVMETSNLNWLAETVSHEWIHNVLTLRPLGASYFKSPELRIMNETTANLAGKEIGATLIERFYQELVPPPAPPPAPPSEESEQLSPPQPPAFDFRTEMHETRVTADELLAEGKIEEAEAYMEARHQVFWENGYHYIRKLNQAYFAFYGAYADQPGGAAGAVEDPVGEAVRRLRAQSASLAEFVNRISWMWSLEQLQQAVAANNH